MDYGYTLVFGKYMNEEVEQLRFKRVLGDFLAERLLNERHTVFHLREKDTEAEDPTNLGSVVPAKLYSIEVTAVREESYNPPVPIEWEIPTPYLFTAKQLIINLLSRTFLNEFRPSRVDRIKRKFK